MIVVVIFVFIVGLTGAGLDVAQVDVGKGDKGACPWSGSYGWTSETEAGAMLCAPDFQPNFESDHMILV